MRILTLCCWLAASPGLADELSVTPLDFWTVELNCSTNLPDGESLSARTTVTQPQGFAKVLESPVDVSDGKIRWHIVYPLIDEGRFDVQPGNWNGYWTMGQYRFRVELLSGSEVVQTAVATFDPMSLCPHDGYGPIFTKYPQQFIECSSVQPAYIDCDPMSFTIRTLPNRVAHCKAQVDVTARGKQESLAGPWLMELTGNVQQQEFDSSGWPRGEYWIRIQLQKDGQSTGPMLIRKVWKEVLPPLKLSAGPRRIGTHPQPMAGPVGWKTAQGICFVADPLRKQPDGPLIVMDRPWETELLYYKTLHYDTDENQYVLEYALAGGDKERETERAELPSTVCQAVSKNGLVWTKPSLRLVDFQGSSDNNLVPSGQEYRSPRPANLAPDLAHDFDKARFRQYDPEQDGLVNLDHVFVTAVKRSFVNQCNDTSSHPYRVGSWPMEKRNNDYLVLTDKAILYLVWEWTCTIRLRRSPCTLRRSRPATCIISFDQEHRLTLPTTHPTTTCTWRAACWESCGPTTV